MLLYKIPDTIKGKLYFLKAEETYGTSFEDEGNSTLKQKKKKKRVLWNATAKHQDLYCQGLNLAVQILQSSLVLRSAEFNLSAFSEMQTIVVSLFTCLCNAFNSSPLEL